MGSIYLPHKEGIIRGMIGVARSRSQPRRYASEMGLLTPFPWSTDILLGTPLTLITAASGGPDDDTPQPGEGVVGFLRLKRGSDLLEKIVDTAGEWVTGKVYNHCQKEIPDKPDKVVLIFQDIAGTFWAIDPDESSSSGTGLSSSSGA